MVGANPEEGREGRGRPMVLASCNGDVDDEFDCSIEASVVVHILALASAAIATSSTVVSSRCQHHVDVCRARREVQAEGDVRLTQSAYGQDTAVVAGAVEVEDGDEHCLCRASGRRRASSRSAASR